MDCLIPGEHPSEIGVPQNVEPDASCSECGNCCRNIWATTDINTVLYFQERGFLVRQVRGKEYMDDIKENGGFYSPGLYIWNEDNRPFDEQEPETSVDIIIVGDCINLVNNICIDYANRPEKPCIGFPQGSSQCNSNRSQIGLSPIIDINSIGLMS